MKRQMLILMTGLLTTGCIHGAAITAAVGPQFGVDGGAGVVTTFEFTRIQHTERRARRPPDEGMRNAIGIGLTGQMIGGWESEGGGFGGFALGFDYLPFLGQWGFVNLGGGAGVAIQDQGPGLLVVAPRLGLVITPWELGLGHWGFGARLHCQFAKNGANLCGPAFTMTQLLID